MLKTPSATGHGSATVPATGGIRHVQVWFGPADRPLYGWLSIPRGATARGGVVLCPPMGEESRAAHRTFRRLAEALAGAGLIALRFDYDGTGDSAGRQDDPRRVESWLASVEAARAYLGGLGVEQVSAVGMRLGATLAGCHAAVAGGFHSLVLWDPCVSGRTFLREGQALHSFGGYDPDTGDGLRHTPGYQYDAATAEGLRRVDLSTLPTDRSLAARILLLSRVDRPVPPGVQARVQQDAGTAVIEPAWEQDRLLDLPPSENLVPQRALRRVVEWLAEGAGAGVPLRDPVPEHRVQVVPAGPGSAAVTERSLRLGEVGLYGIAVEPVPAAPGRGGADSVEEPRPWVVLINVAAEHHVGPGRRWVEFARSWAGLGYRCIRLDQSGIGDSPTHPGRVEDRLYAPEWIDDLRQVVDTLGADGSPVALIGLCSGAYSALEAALWTDVAGVFAINPQTTLYDAARGMAIHTRRRRAATVPIGPIARLARTHRTTAGGLWRLYRQVAWRHSSALVLGRVIQRGTTLRVVSNHCDSRQFTDVLVIRPWLSRLRRHPRFSFEIDEIYHHSLLSRRSQLRTYERATAFVQEIHRSERSTRT